MVIHFWGTILAGDLALLSDMALIRLQAETLFRIGRGGRMLALNELNPGRPAPRIFLGRTRAGTIRRFRYDMLQLAHVSTRS